MTFEYEQYPLEVPGLRASLEPYLREIWKARSFPYASDFEPEPTEEIEKPAYQPFFRFDGDTIHAKNYIGFVQLEGHLLEVYPKVFRQGGLNQDKGMMLKHIFFWFRYCRKIRFPYSETNLDSSPETNIPELLIWLFASQCLETIQTNPYHTYEETSEILASPRGRIDFQAYTRNGLAKGLYHRIDCVHEPFVYDNQVNRVIKYVCRLLQPLARFGDTNELLRKIIFTLDDVEDIPCHASSIHSVGLNPFFSEYAPILDWCKRFLEQHLYSHRPYELKTWSLLLPMEYVFEDFIAGFMELEFPGWKLEYQKSDLYLSDSPKAFQMKHDIFLQNRQNRGLHVIVDTKYKSRNYKYGDSKRGVSQADMYQVFSYAVRRNCSNILLIYPNYQEVCEAPVHFDIDAPWMPTSKIIITVIEIPFWSSQGFKGLADQIRKSLSSILAS